jgi:hypothetical protein
MWGRLEWSPETLALTVFALTTVAAFIPRARSMELRYFAPLAVLVGSALMLAVLKVLAALTWRTPLVIATVLVSAHWWLIWIPVLDAWECTGYPQAAPFYVQMRKAYREANAGLGGCGPVVVGEFPYQFTWYTGRPALSMPLSDDADDAYLLAYMKRFGARWILLTPYERGFFRRRWLNAGGLPPQLRLVGRVDFLLVYERVE